MRRVSPLLLVLVAASLVACRAPRDPELDEHIEARQSQPRTTKPADSAGTPKAAAPKRKRDPKTPPPKGQVERRVYSEAEVTELMDSITGEGEVLELALETAEGTIRCELAPEAAPQTVTNLVALVTGRRDWRDPDTGDISRGRFYDGLTFHRTIANFIIQTGNPSAIGAGGPGWTLTREPGLKDVFGRGGVLAMVDAGEDSHGSQFFITTRASTSLEGRYTPFGTCDNAELVKKIADAEKHPPKSEGKSATRSVRPTRIKRAVVTRRSKP